jgi:DNA-binding NarL/FixJ family response regulator
MVSRVPFATGPMVAVVNSNEDVIDMLRTLLEDEGFRTVGALSTHLRRGQPTPDAFLRTHDPRVVLWDIAVPYDVSWGFFQEVRASSAGAGRRFIVTTFNRQGLAALVSTTEASEILGKPDDLAVLADIVRAAAADA